MTRILIGGVGYRHLCDHSFGVCVADALARREWPPEIAIEDLSYNPIAVVQRLQDEPPDRRFELAIVIGAAERPGRATGTLQAYVWDRALPPAEQIQAAIAEGVTGVIALENTLVVARHFGALPATVVVIEVEPEAHEAGDRMTPAVADACTRAEQLACALAAQPAAVAKLGTGALPPPRARHTGIVLDHVHG